MLRCSRSPNFQSNICRKIISQHKNMLILTEIVKLASFWIFLLSWIFFIHNLSRAFSLEHKRMAHILFFFFFNSHKLFVSCQDLNLYNGVLFPFTPTHLNLQFQKGAAGRFIHYMFSTFLENWLLKHWLGFLGSMCDVWLYLCDSDKNTWLKCQRLNNMTQGVLS